ncbi:MAG: AAA family ATPase, partial [Pseudomonadales bacterium]
MSIITMATTKGGAGKTTVAQMIIGAVGHQGFSVGVVDCDPNGTLSNWLGECSNLDLDYKHVADDTQIVAQARKLEAKNDLVVIDTAGFHSQATIFAVGAADLVLIPCQLSNGDVIEAVKTSRVVQSAAEMANREIPARVIYTDYTPKTNIAKQVRQKIKKSGLTALDTRLHHLVAFKELTFNGKVPKKGTAGAQGQLLVQELAEKGYLPF